MPPVRRTLLCRLEARGRVSLFIRRRAYRLSISLGEFPANTRHGVVDGGVVVAEYIISTCPCLEEKGILVAWGQTLVRVLPQRLFPFVRASSVFLAGLFKTVYRSLLRRRAVLP